MPDGVAASYDSLREFVAASRVNLQGATQQVERVRPGANEIQPNREAELLQSNKTGENLQTTTERENQFSANALRVV